MELYGSQHDRSVSLITKRVGRKACDVASSWYAACQATAEESERYSARADLVVIGRHSGPGTGPAVASVQHTLLNHARGPVAIVPAAR